MHTFSNTGLAQDTHLFVAGSFWNLPHKEFDRLLPYSKVIVRASPLRVVDLRTGKDKPGKLSLLRKGNEGTNEEKRALGGIRA